MTQHQKVLQGQALAGTQYPGQRPVASMQALAGRPGQRPVSGPESIPEVDPLEGKCTRARVVDGHHQRCGAWAVKDDPDQYCIGHKRERDKAQVNNGDEPTADQGLRQDQS